MTNPNPPNTLDEPCSRNFNDGGAHTVRVTNGIAYCLSCNQPTRKHIKQPVPSNKEVDI